MMNNSQSFLQKLNIINLSNEYNDKKLLEKECHNFASHSICPGLGRWVELPSSILEQIYTYVDKSDLLNMSLVCKNCSHDEYGSPCLWKTFSFDLSAKQTESGVWPAVKFAQKFASMFRHIEIKGKPRLRKRKIIKSFSQMQLFFETITRSKCQILSIKFNNMYGYNRSLNEIDYFKFLQSVSNFMRNQHHLHTVEFHNCSFNSANGISFPRLICESIANTLSTLVLKGKDGRGTFGNNLILEYGIVLQNLNNLKILKTDYTINFEKTLCNFCDEISTPNEMTKKLSLFELHCDGSEINPIRRIPQEAWQHLRNICPDLKVKFNLVYSRRLRNNFEFYFVKYMPLVHLELRIEKALVFETVLMGDLIRHLSECRLNEHLEDLSIVWMPAIRNISTDLILFLQACKKLKNFQMTIRYPVSGLEDLIESMLLNRPASLKSINFSIIVKNETGRKYVTSLTEKYGPLLQDIGQLLTSVSMLKISH